MKDCKGYNTFKFGDIKVFLQAVEKTIGQSVDMDKILPQFEKVKIKASYKNVYERVINK